MQPKDGSHSSLRIINQQKILSEIVLSGEITRTELTDKTGLTNASVSRITKSLIDAGLIIESDQPVSISGPGRRFINLKINSQGAFVVGIKINALRQSIVILDLSKNELAKKELRLKSFSNPIQVLEKIASKALNLIEKLDLDKHKILGVGVAITGAVDSKSGLLINAPALGWQGINISQTLGQSLDLPIHVENLPNAINLCEYRFGTTNNYHSIIAINAALGIGSSLILDGRLIRGSSNSAGLLGQLSFTDSGKFKNKTIDDLTAGWRILSELGHKNYPLNQHRKAASQLTEILNPKLSTDKKVAKALKAAGKSLGRVIELYIAMTNPQAILLSGPLAQNPQYVDVVKQRLSDYTTKTLISELSGSTAAGWLAINEFLIQRPIDLNKFNLAEAA